MTFQSSFLIRCSLHSPAEAQPGKLYYIQHVQTGACHRAATLSELTQWMAEQNVLYLEQMLGSGPDGAAGQEESR